LNQKLTLESCEQKSYPQGKRYEQKDVNKNVVNQKVVNKNVVNQKVVNQKVTHKVKVVNKKL